MKFSIGLNIALLFSISGCFLNAAEFNNSLPALADDPEFNDSLLQETYHYTVSENKKQIANTRDPLIIMLSACAGMGKTTVAKLLQENLGILRFNGDDTRVFLKSKKNYHVDLPLEIKLGRVLKCFDYFVAKCKTELPNKAIIFDDSIDRARTRYYERITEISQNYGYPTYLVRLQVPKHIALQRVLVRETDPEARAHYTRNFDDYCLDYEQFDTTRANYFLDNSAEAEHIPIAPLLERIQEKINSK